MQNLPLYQSNYKFHDISPPNNASLNRNMSVNKHAVPGARVFSLDNFLSNEECDYFIAQAEQCGFESLLNEYPEKYRNNERYVFL